VDRLWRNNRQTFPNTTCVGTNLNRNWPFQWRVVHPDVADGSTDDPCDPDYLFRGFAPGDTPEVSGAIAFIDAIHNINPHGIKWFVDFHSYSELILLSYGDCGVTPPPANADIKLQIARGMADAIRSVDNQSYVPARACITYGEKPIATGGMAPDYFSSRGAEFSNTIELRPNPRIGEDYGFELPSEFILPNGKEIWEGIKYVLANIR
jgi:carboxypeptidase A4